MVAGTAGIWQNCTTFHSLLISNLSTFLSWRMQSLMGQTFSSSAVYFPISSFFLEYSEGNPLFVLPLCNFYSLSPAQNWSSSLRRMCFVPFISLTQFFFISLLSSTQFFFHSSVQHNFFSHSSGQHSFHSHSSAQQSFVQLNIPHAFNNSMQV